MKQENLQSLAQNIFQELFNNDLIGLTLSKNHIQIYLEHHDIIEFKNAAKSAEIIENLHPIIFKIANNFHIEELKAADIETLNNQLDNKLKEYLPSFNHVEIGNLAHAVNIEWRLKKKLTSLMSAL